MFGWEFPPHNSGGLGVACLGLANGLLSQNVDITFVLPKSADYDSESMKFRFAEESPNYSSSIKIKEVETLLHPYITEDIYSEKYNTQTHVKVYGNSLMEEVARYAKVAAEIAMSEDFDVIHAHDWLSFGAGIAAKKATGKPLVMHIHATEFDRSGGAGGNQAIYEIEKRGFEEADVVAAVSEFTRQSVIRNYGIDANKIQVVHNGIDKESMEIATKEHEEIVKLKEAGNKIVMFLGRHTIQKGADKFLEAANRVLEYEPNIVFLMVGGGDMTSNLMQLSQELGIADKVLFPGFLRGMEKAQVYKTADLFVMPSVSEPFGIVPLEALINGTPVLISKQSGVSEVLQNSLKVDFWDIDEMSNKILAVLKYGALHHHLAENGENEVEKITWTKAAIKVKEIYSNLLGLAT